MGALAIMRQLSFGPPILEVLFRRREQILRAGDPYVEGGQQKDADEKRSDESADDDDGEGPLRV